MLDLIKMEKISCPKSIFFCGGSWGCLFYIGIYKAIIERWGKECLDKIKFGGNSSGAMVATLFALGIYIQQAEEIYKFLANKATNEGVFMKMSNYHIEALNKVFKNGDFTAPYATYDSQVSGLTDRYVRPGAAIHYSSTSRNILFSRMTGGKSLGMSTRISGNGIQTGGI